LDAAAVQQDVDFVAVCDYFFDESGHGVSGGEVGGVDFGFAAEFLDFLTCGLVGFVALEGRVREGGGWVVGGFVVLGLGGCLHRLRRGRWPLLDRFLVLVLVCGSMELLEMGIPRVPPVTRAVWPSREKSCCTDAMVCVCEIGCL
jgi:hypothetical protein